MQRTDNRIVKPFKKTVIIVSGPGQKGKTTLCSKLQKPGLTLLQLDYFTCLYVKSHPDSILAVNNKKYLSVIHLYLDKVYQSELENPDPQYRKLLIEQIKNITNEIIIMEGAIFMNPDFYDFICKSLVKEDIRIWKMSPEMYSDE